MMSGYPITLPALGEGIVELRVMSILKEAGARVERDEPIAEVETDKATFAIESPVSGVVGVWNVVAGNVYPVGTEATRVLDETPEPSRPQATRNSALSPRARAAARANGVDPSQLDLRIGPEQPFKNRNRGTRPDGQSAVEGTATVEVHVNWVALEKQAHGVNTRTQVWIAWASGLALNQSPQFRSWGTDTRLGIAVALLRDRLAIYGIPDEVAEGEFSNFEQDFLAGIDAVRMKQNEAKTCALILSDMSSFGVRSATPVVTASALATLFVGEPFLAPSLEGEWRREAKLVLAFDHSAMNGAGAARFLRKVRSLLEGEE